MSRKRKRRLTKEELDEIRDWMESASPGNKPNIRQIAKRYGVNQPSVVKSLKGWKGIRRGRPEPPKRSELKRILSDPNKAQTIEGYTTNLDPDDIRRSL